MAGCQQPPALDDPAPKLPVPASLPPFAIWPDPPTPLVRSDELLVQGKAELAKGDLQSAVRTLTEALAVCPANALARLELARTFARAGRSSVALTLLEPARKSATSCGQCLEILLKVKVDKDFSHLAATKEGKAMLAGLPAGPLPLERWATEASAALQKGSPEALAPFMHPSFPLRWIRSCPDCDNAIAKEPQMRLVVGPSRIGKIAQRFDTSVPQLRNAPLQVQGRGACSERCCSWPVLKPLAEGQVALERLCFAPMTPEAAVMSELVLVYGPPARLPQVAPLPGVPTETGAGSHP